MNSKRNFANIARCVNGVEDDGQALHQFMSNSPWSSADVFVQLRREIRETPGVQSGSVLILDESADEKAGEQSAGASQPVSHRRALGNGVVHHAGPFCIETAQPLSRRSEIKPVPLLGQRGGARRKTSRALDDVPMRERIDRHDAVMWHCSHCRP